MKNSVAVNLLSQMFLAQFSEEEHEALGMAIDALNAPSTHREESQRTKGVGSVGWIPCDERLPSESDYYLVTIINPFGEKEVCVIWFAYKADYGVSEWREITNDDTVLAWMPLPEPYREDGEEE